MPDTLELANAVGVALKKKGWLVATAESCTGGGVAQAITDVAGASEWFVGGFVAYANDCKIVMLDVPANELAVHGAVSEPVAVAMARGALRKTQADVAVSTTGIAGPGGAVPGKPVGTVWMACVTRDSATAECRVFAGDRHAVRAQASMRVLRMLLDCLQALPDRPPS